MIGKEKEKLWEQCPKLGGMGSSVQAGGRPQTGARP